MFEANVVSCWLNAVAEVADVDGEAGVEATGVVVAVDPAWEVSSPPPHAESARARTGAEIRSAVVRQFTSRTPCEGLQEGRAAACGQVV
jgi:hypothetical protein